MKTNNQQRSLLKQRTGIIANRVASILKCLPYTSQLALVVACCIGLWLILTPFWPRVQAGQISPDGIWEVVAPETTGEQAQARSYLLHATALTQVLALAPAEEDGVLNTSPAVISMPLPDGTFARFRLEASPVLEPALTARYPELKSYRGRGIENPRLSLRFDWTPEGLRAFISDGASLAVIESPVTPMRKLYVSRAGEDYATVAEEARCLTGETTDETKAHRRMVNNRALNSSVGTTLRTFRLAVAATWEYCNTYGSGTNTGTMNSLNARLNALNLIYERELSVHLNLVNNVNLLFTTQRGFNVGSDPFTNNDAATMLTQVRSHFQTNVDPATYDVAQVWGTGTTSGGYSYVGVVCETATDAGGPYKAGGVTLFSGSESTSIASGWLEHELGHQFGATHTYNSTRGGCSTGRDSSTAYESGSGLTIMSLAGNCSDGTGSDNLASQRATHFHAGSFEQITEYLAAAATCATTTSTGNNVPMVNGGANYIIPKLTPFTLTAAGSDADVGDAAALTYTWEQTDAGGAYTNPSYEDAGDPVSTTRPIFRPFVPALFPAPAPTPPLTRTFPKMAYILDSASPNNPPDFDGSGFRVAEKLPTTARELNFRVTVRDGRGGVANDAVRVVVTDGGPFQVDAVTSPWTIGTTRSITWQPGNTNQAPIDCGSVKISLSVDGGMSFPHTLAAATPNDGSEDIILPMNISATGGARLKIEAVGNIFFDISNTNFAIQVPTCIYTPTPSTQSVPPSGGSGYSFSIGTNGGCSWTVTSNAAWLTITGSSSGTGNSVINYSVAPNTGTPIRTGTISIVGQAYTQTFTVRQTSNFNGLQYFPLPSPIRLLDTRSGAGISGCTTGVGTLSPTTIHTQPARTACSNVPANAVAVTGNVTVVPGSTGGYLALYPSDVTQPLVASSNYGPGEVVNNVYTTGLGNADGAFKIYASSTTHVIVDVTGYYAPLGTGGLYFHALPSPVRLLETRTGLSGCIAPGAPLVGTGNPNADPNLDLLLQGRSPVASPCNAIPAAAQMLVGNATSIFPTGGGYLTIYPSGGTRPPVASSNYVGNDILNGPFAVKLGADGKFKVYTLSTTHLVIDILGYYSTEATDANGAGLLFNPLPNPVRLLETRPDFPNFPLTGCTRPNAPIAGNLNMATHTQMAANFCGLPPTAQAVVGNVSVVNTVGAGYLTLFPANLVAAPLVATSNYPTPATFGYNRHFIVGLGPEDGKFKVLTQYTTELILDVSGYFVP